MIVRSPQGFIALWNLVTNPDGRHHQSLREISLKFDEEGEVRLEKFLGEGHWAYAFLAHKIDYEGREPKKFVLKMLKPSPANCVVKTFRRVEQKVINIDKQFKTEVELFKKFYGVGELKRLIINGRLLTFTLISYLGDMSLEDLMSKKSYYLKIIPIPEWLKFFEILFLKLKDFHQCTGYLHNDIKPENITLSFKPDLLGFSEVAFIDLANAHKRRCRGIFGDPRYQPLTTFPGVLFPIKDESIDVYALGKVCGEVVKVLQKYFKKDVDACVLERCKKIFDKSSALTRASSIDKTIEDLNNCKHAYEYIRRP